MGEVTGPISTLPGRGHDFPDGTMCDHHPERPAVARIQGETDSFGCEMNDMRQECLDEHRAYMRSPEATTGRCDWCKKDAADLRTTRDYEEGMCGPVYEVCGACRQRRDEAAQAELDAFDDGGWDEPEDDYDPREECGRWDQRAPGGMAQQCQYAGSEYCEFCPYRSAPAPSLSAGENVR